MKKVIFVVIAGSVLYTYQSAAQTSPNVANSQPNAAVKKKQHLSPEERAQKSVNKLDEIVQLTADQKTKVYDLSLKRAKEVDAVFEKYKGQKDKKEVAKQEVQQIRKKYREEIKSVLTPEQIEKLKAYHKAHHPEKPAGKPEEMVPDGDN